MVYTNGMNTARLQRINFCLLGLIIVINLYTIALPFLPGLDYWWRTRSGDKPVSVAAYIKKTAKTDSSKPGEDMSGNRIIIPRMSLNTPLLEGPQDDSFNLLKAGAWHLPFSTNPTESGNMVVAAHRFSYTGPRGLFYFLDKLQLGDEIGVQWGGKLYSYQVVSSHAVAPTEVSVQQPTNDTRLTLYTCTPLFNPVNRLVVVAKPIEGATP